MPNSDVLAKPRSPMVLSEADATGSPGFGKALVLLDYWRKLARGNHLHRVDLDPLEIGADILPNLVLIDVLDGGADFRWRLFGGAHEQEYGLSLKGVALSSLMRENPNLSEILHIFQRCTALKEPVFYEVRYRNDRDCPRAARGVLLPLLDDRDDQVACIVGCSEWVTLR